MTYFSKRRNCYFSSLTFLQIAQSGELCTLIFNRNWGRKRKTILRSNGLLFDSIVRAYFFIDQMNYFFLLKIVLVLNVAISV